MSEKGEDQETITQKEFLDGCMGCSSVGCLPFIMGVLVMILVYG